MAETVDNGSGVGAHKAAGKDRPAAPETGAGDSSPYRRARRDRGAETRARLIEAALDVFGRYGFEGATTRQIAKEADANLAAIVYHFGSKEALHLAVAEYIVGRIGALVGPALAAAQAPEASATPAAARATLLGVFGTFIDVILGTEEAERWARFIVREQMQPTAAFEAIYGFMGGAHGLGSRLVATVLGRDEGDEEVRLRTFTMIGQVLVFRVAQALVLRRMGWQAIGETERAAIKRVIVENIELILRDAAR
jgi:TetR/AcrR family transcriptional regulator, regulator of cefoperazone and chloramphenicol sensitivity